MPVLTPLIDRDQEVFGEIGDAKRHPRRARLRRLRPVVAGRYDEYCRLLPRLQGISKCSLTSNQQVDCLHCYDSATAPLGRLIETILGIRPTNGSPLCQYCLIGEVDCIDHYVPKALFPEFSVLPRNLVPACSRCNRLKDTAWLTGQSREIFNLYYEDIPSVSFLQVAVTFPQRDRAAISFQLEQPSAICNTQFGRITRHFERLKLIERYNVRAAEEVSELLGIVRRIADLGRDSLSTVLDNMANSHVDRHGANYWKGVLTREIANNDDFFTAVGI